MIPKLIRVNENVRWPRAERVMNDKGNFLRDMPSQDVKGRYRNESLRERVPFPQERRIGLVQPGGPGSG